MKTAVYAIRGAVMVDNPHEEEQEMVRSMGMLLDRIIEKNSLLIEDIISIQLTQTSDLSLKNAATALREARSQFGKIPLFCSQEPSIRSMPPRIVRALITCHGEGPGRHVYLGETQNLRPEL